MGLVGGGLAPVLLFYGLREAAAMDAALLLTMEFVATALLAYVFLAERASGRAGAGLALLFASALLVAIPGGREDTGTTARGVALILASAVAWGVDNAVSAHLVGIYRPHQLIAVKGLLGGLAAAAAAVAVGVHLPDVPAAGQVALMGVASISCSSLLFYHALRLVGAARTSAVNIATTAIVGAVGGAWLLAEPFGWLHAAAIAMVVAGSLLLAERKAAAVAPSPAAA
jgi:drug/metabolite transporter (DMT)-like permease